ncbi:MAG TPA: hypothetical protein PKU69_02370, partial [Bacillota bacterium]|nr:hypothetical protein [Bacillota bacterium]
SKQIIDMDGTTIVLPSSDVLTSSITALVDTTNYIVKGEIKSLLNAMDLLGFSGSLDGFGGNVDLTKVSSSNDQDTLLLSAIMHATITDQLIGLDGDALVIPDKNLNDEDVEVVVLGNTFIIKSEIKALLSAMNVLGIGGNVGNFGGDIGLSALFASENVDYDSNQDTVLLSAIMHATITDQITKLSGVTVPTTDVNGDSIRDLTYPTDYFNKLEIKALLNALDILEFPDNLGDFDGAIGLTHLFAQSDPEYDNNQDVVLTSAIMHATMSNQIANMSDIILPTKDVFGTFVRLDVSGNDYFTTLEIKSLINALDVVGFSGDFSTFGGSIGIDSLDNDADQTTLLLSAIMHATLSDKLVNQSNDAFVIPDTNTNTSVDIRVTQAGVLFIEKNEVKALLIALNQMELTEYATMDVTPGDIFKADFNDVLTSAIMQATISQNILAGSTDEFSPVNGKLIVPLYFRDDIDVDGVTQKWIIKTELYNLLVALDAIGIDDFTTVTVGGDVFGAMDGTQIDTILDSGSMHITIDNMLKENGSINSSIPDIALYPANIYDISGVILRDEIKYFILGVQPIGGGDISAAIDFNSFTGLDQNQRDTALVSMIIRCKVTPDLTTYMAINMTPFTAADYETGATPATLIYQSAKDAFDLLYPV